MLVFFVYLFCKDPAWLYLYKSTSCRLVACIEVAHTSIVIITHHGMNRGAVDADRPASSYLRHRLGTYSRQADSRY